MSTPAFLALLTSLPTGNSTIRMRVWRALKNTGCGVLRDGVYVLPIGAPQGEALIAAETEIRAAGGFAMTVELTLRSPTQIEYVRKLFDRSKEYAALVAKSGAAKLALKRLGKRKADTLVRRLRRSFEELAAIDFHPGQAHLQTKQAMSALDLEMERLFAEGEPHSSKRKLRRLDHKKYRSRRWATRKDLWVDRLASAWLIKRFIDRSAKFVWLDLPRNRPKGSVGFDFDGADFTHVDGHVTFEVLLASFGLDDDAALVAIGHAVHHLDVGGIPVADAKGLETILKGMKAKALDDDLLVLEAGKIFDLLYAAYGQQPPGNA